MKGRYTVQDWYRTKITSDILPIDSSWDPLTEFSFTVQSVPQDDEWRLVVNFNDTDKRDKIYFHRKTLTELYYYRKNRSNPSKLHEENDYIQMNNFAEWFNYNFDNNDDFWLVLNMWTNKAQILWWIVDYGTWVLTITPTAITTLADWTHYAVLDFADWFLKFVTTYDDTIHYLVWEVVVAWSLITSKSDKRNLSLLKNKSVLNKVTDVWWKLYYDWNPVWTSYTPEDIANKETSALDSSTTKYPCNNVVKAAVDSKVDKVTWKWLSEEDFTTAEKAKLATLSDHFRWTYLTLLALETAVPTGNLWDYATVDPGAWTEATKYIWDTDEWWVLSAWVGAVYSVNSQIGNVILTADEVPETATRRYMSEAQENKLDWLNDQTLEITDNTTNDASISKHGFLPKLPWDVNTVLRWDWTFWAFSSWSSFWTLLWWTPTRVSDTSFSFTDVWWANRLLMSAGTVIRRNISWITKLAVVTNSTYSTDVTTVTIMWDAMTSIDASSLKYAMVKSSEVNFTYPLTVAVWTDIMWTYYAATYLKVFWALAYHKTAGTTNATTYDVNINWVTMFPTKISVASWSTISSYTSSWYSVSPTQIITVDCDTVSTTAPIYATIKLFVFPLYYIKLS